MRKCGDAGAPFLRRSFRTGCDASVDSRIRCSVAGEGGGRTRKCGSQRSPRGWLACCEPRSVADDIALSQGFSKSAGVRDHFFLGHRKQTGVPGGDDFDESPDSDQGVHAKGYLVGILSEVWPACVNDQLRCFLERHGAAVLQR